MKLRHFYLKKFTVVATFICAGFVMSLTNTYASTTSIADKPATTSTTETPYPKIAKAFAPIFGYWQINGGTDACPKELFIKKADFCEGFEIIDTDIKSVFRESFCQINGMAREELQAENTFNINSKSKNNIATKVTCTLNENIFMREQIDPKTKLEIQTRLSFQNKKLMLDRKFNSKGWSCLYDLDAEKK